MKTNGFIVLHRQILDWEWYADINTRCLFIHLLLRASFKDDEWRGIKISKGQLITSLESLAKETGLTKQNVRTSLSKLKSTREITYTSTHNYTIITIANWEFYQDCTRKSTRQSHANHTQTNIGLTPYEIKETRIYEYIHKTKKKQVNIDFVDKEFVDLFTKWLDYKVGEDQMYKSDVSLKQCYNNLLKISNASPQIAMEIVNNSIGNGWKGLFPLKQNQQTEDKRLTTYNTPCPR